MEIIDKNIKYVQYTEVRFASFFSGGFTYYGSNESTGKETGKTHLYGLCSTSVVILRRKHSIG